MGEDFLGKSVHWLLFAVTIVYFVTGLGITQYRVFELLSFGLLEKNLLFRVHEQLGAPFLILLVIHVFKKTERYFLKKGSDA